MKGTDNMRRRTLALVTVITLFLGFAAFFGWRWHERSALVAAAIPARPNFAKFPVAIVDRVNAAERKARGGSVDALAELASLYQINGFMPEAERCLTALVRLQPKEPKWPHRIASIRAGYGELDTAIQLWERTVRLAPKYVPAQIRLGDSYLKLNRDADATRAYNRVLELDASNPYALVGLARLDLKAGQATRAKERLEKAAEQSNWAIGTDLLVSVYEQLGDNDRAIALRARAKSAGTYFDPPDPWMDEMLDDCYDVFRLTLAAGFADHSGDSAGSRRILERAAALAPQDGHVLLQLGMLCRSTHDNAAARQYLERAAEVQPNLSDAWAQLVDFYLVAGDDASAARALSAGLRNCPQSPGLHLQRARRLAAAGEIEAAEAEFRTTFQLRPDEADPLIELAQLYLKQNRTREAVAELHRALESEPEHPVALTTLALYSIAVGDERAARDWLRRAQLQVRVSRDMLSQLTARFAQRFGHPYTPDSNLLSQ